MLTRLIKRLRDNRGDEGLTLIEVVVAIMIFGLISTILFSLFNTSNGATNAVRGASTTLQEAQITTSQLDKDVRNAVVMKISPNGTRLDLENSSGDCTSWVYYDGGLYVDHQDSVAVDFDASDWTQRVSDATLLSGRDFFTQQLNGVNYAYKAGKSVGSIEITGESFMRVPADRELSTCFGDDVEVVEPTPTPTPTPDPTTPPAPVTYNLTYNLAGGTLAGSNPSSYLATTETFTLVNPTRSGYTFSGWTGTGLTVANTSVSIAKGSTGDRSYTATWTEDTPVVTPPAGGIKLTADYRVDGSWGSGGNINIRVTSTAAQNGNWKMTFNLPAGRSVSPWHMNCSQAGTLVTCVPNSWNATFGAAGETRDYGFGVNGGNPPSNLTITFSAN